MGSLSALEAIQLLLSSGVLAGGVGVFKWALGTERRLMRIEVKLKLGETS